MTIKPYRIVVKCILEPRILRCNADCPANIPIDVVEVIVAVAAKVVLLSLGAIHQKVVMRLVKAAAIIVINRLLRIIVINYKVVMDLAPPGMHGGRAVTDSCQERLAVPAVERAMIPAFSACGEDKIVCELVRAAKAIIKVDAGTWAIEEDVAKEVRLRGLGLEIKAGLLLIQPNFASEIPNNGVVSGMVAISAVKPLEAIGLVRVSPARHGIASKPAELAVGDCCVAVVARDHDCVAVKSRKVALVNHDALCAFKEHSRHAVQSPVAA